LLDATPRHRTSYAAYYNLWNGVAIFCGAILGGVLAQHFGNAQFLWFGGILIVFMISGILRLASTAFLFPWIKEVVPREPVNERKLFLDAVVVHPSRAIFNEVQQTGSSVVTIVEKGLLRGVDGVRDGMKFTRMGLRGWKRGFENFLFK
jgi:MFS family permease